MESRAFVSQYFAGSFTGDGFTNFLPEAIQGMKKIYIIKGTAGSGKSTLMRKIATVAETVGEKVERIYCSSDVTSLDGVVIPSLSFAIVDGTAPHVMEAVYPLALETIINTTDYIFADDLHSKSEEIISLSNRKKALFTQAQRLLHSAHSLNTLKSEIMQGCYDAVKGYKFCIRVIAKEKLHDTEKATTRRSCVAFGKNGITYLTPFCDAEKIYSVNENFAPFILGTLKLLASEHKIPIIYSPSPLCVNETALIYFPTSKRLFVSSQFEMNGEQISDRRFEYKDSLKSCKEKRKFLTKTAELILEEARLTLSEAMEQHKKLEEIYVSALNKEGLDCLTQSIIISLFGEK